jgi:hypothetical protein
MPKKIAIVGIPSIVIAACVSFGLIAARGSEAAAETGAVYPSVSTQLFDGSPIGGEIHSLAPAAAPASDEAAWPAVRAQIFEPDAIGTARSRFSGPTLSADVTDPNKPTREGRSVGRGMEARPSPVPAKEIAPAPQSGACEPKPSARTMELQFGSLEHNQTTA